MENTQKGGYIMSVTLVNVYTGKRTNITERYVSHKQVGFSDVMVTLKGSFIDGKWVDQKSEVYEDYYIDIIP